MLKKIYYKLKYIKILKIQQNSLKIFIFIYIFAMSKKEKKKAQGGLPLHLSVLESVQSGITGDKTLEDEQIKKFMSGEDTAEAVEVEDSDERTGSEKIDHPENITVEEVPSMLLDDDFHKWIEDVKRRPKTQEKALVNLDPNVIDVFTLVKRIFKIPINHTINCILNDWIETHKDDLKELFYAQRSTKFLKD